MTEPQDWQDDEDVVRFQTAAAFGPNHSVLWEARVRREPEGDCWTWHVSQEWPFMADAGGSEDTEAGAKNAVEWTLERWRHCDAARVAELETARVAALETALADILKISEDRERFVLMGPRGWMEAEQIAESALLKGASD